MRRTELPAQQLASELGKDIEAELELDKQLDRARDAIVAAVRERRLPAWGRLVAGGPPLATRAPHEKIDPALFLSPLTIGRDNEVAVDTRLPEREWLTYQGPRFVEVHFDGEDVSHLRPPMEATPPAIDPVIVNTSIQCWAAQGEPNPSKGAGNPNHHHRLAVPNRPGGGGRKSAAATEAMIHAVKSGAIAFGALRRMKQKALVTLYRDAGRTVLAQSREAALAALLAAGHSDTIPTNDK